MYLRKENIESRKNIFKTFIKTTAVFFLIAGSWITIMSLHEHRFVISDSGKYNISMLDQKHDDKKGETVHVVLQKGLFAPPNEYATSAWEQLHKTNPDHWSPFDSADSFKQWLRKIKENILTIYYFDFQRQIGNLLLLLLIVFFLLKGKLSQFPEGLKDFFYFVLIFNAGYILITIDHRYIFIDT